MTRNRITLLVSAAVVVATIAYFKVQKTAPVTRDEKIQISMDTVNAKNQEALDLCKTQINTLLTQQFPEITHQGQLSAGDVTTYGSCCTIICYLARDKIMGSKTALQYIDERMQSHLQNPLKKLSENLEIITDRLDLSLEKNTSELAHDLAQNSSRKPDGSTTTLLVQIDLKSNADINTSIMNLRTGIQPDIIKIIYSILNTKIVKTLVSKISVTAGRLFAKDVAEAATEGGVATTGLETVGVSDVVAGVGAAWTAYDVYSIQKQFKQEIEQSVQNMMPGICSEVQKQMFDNASAILLKHQQEQDEMRLESAQKLAK